MFNILPSVLWPGNEATTTQDGSSVGNFGGWGILEHTILLSNYNMRQVYTELRHTASRQDLRLHYIFDFGFKSSNYVFKY